jgi:hypothetical protein
MLQCGLAKLGSITMIRSHRGNPDGIAYLTTRPNIDTAGLGDRISARQVHHAGHASLA